MLRLSSLLAALTVVRALRCAPRSRAPAARFAGARRCKALAASKIAFDGEAGSFAEEAARQAKPDAEPLPCRSSQAVLAAVEDNSATFGVLPVENSATGSLHKSFDLLIEHDLRIHGETLLDPAVSGSERARVMGAPPGSFTRFLVLGKGDGPRPAERAKTSLAFAVIDRPGALAAALGEFGRRGINLLKIESRPRRRVTAPGFSYVFFIGFAGTLEDEDCAAAVFGLLERCAFVRFLGSYEAAPPPAAKEEVYADPALMQI
mmetsp:Transcript_24970/g.74940  ORF Transcript_24970/g.74940 Transcript_24970/m.74940 type:complete len:262 (-) Transcript_24970:22-807(-)